MRDLQPTPLHPPQVLADLSHPAACWLQVCGRLQAGSTTPTHSFRWPVVSTVAADGGPDSRVVVLRRFDAGAGVLVFHTDVRSPKAADLTRNRRCGFLFYDPDDRVQVRVRATASLHHADAFARAEFDALSPITRASYASAGVPGEVEAIDAPFDYPPCLRVDEAVAFRHFVAVACEIESADVLELHPSGHRRVVFGWPVGVLKMTRVGP